MLGSLNLISFFNLDPLVFFSYQNWTQRQIPSNFISDVPTLSLNVLAGEASTKTMSFWYDQMTSSYQKLGLPNPNPEALGFLQSYLNTNGCCGGAGRWRSERDNVVHTASFVERSSDVVVIGLQRGGAQ